MEDKFKIKSYGFGELAQMYFPCISKKSASWQLTKWINENEELSVLLIKFGKKKRQKILTPIQVEQIIKILGEP